MPLHNKYLRYSPQITFDIFKLVWDKLLECGYKPSHKLDKAWEEFAGLFNYLFCNTENTPNQFSDNNKNHKETTVQEILGYDPFVKDVLVQTNMTQSDACNTCKFHNNCDNNLLTNYGDCPAKNGQHYPKDIVESEFVLPESWHIVVTSNNKEILSKWRKVELECNQITGMHSWGHRTTKEHNPVTSKDGFGIEITFDQFKKYVLEQPEEIKTKVEIPEYVKFITEESSGNTDFVKGNTYKVAKDGRVIDADGDHRCEYSIYFQLNEAVPSTKETYEAQNKSKAFPIEGCCKSKSNKLEQYLIKTRGNSDSKMTKERANGVGWNESSYWWLLDTDKSSKKQYNLSDLEAWIGKPTQPLKQAVHCKTQEEWDFATSRIGSSAIKKAGFEKTSNCLNIDGTARCNYEYYSEENYQILSFKEWCDLNNYKMDKQFEFEVGKYYKFRIGNDISSPTRIIRFTGLDKAGRICADLWIMTGDTEFNQSGNDWSIKNVIDPIKLSINEIQQYLPDNHPDKISTTIKKWDVGSYVVFLKKLGRFDPGHIDVIVDKFDGYCVGLKGYLSMTISREAVDEVKWFATLPEAEEFAKTLIEPACTNTNSTRHDGCGEKYGCIQNCDECDYLQPKEEMTPVENLSITELHKSNRIKEYFDKYPINNWDEINKVNSCFAVELKLGRKDCYELDCIDCYFDGSDRQKLKDFLGYKDDAKSTLKPSQIQAVISSYEEILNSSHKMNWGGLILGNPLGEATPLQPIKEEIEFIYLPEPK